MNRTNILKSILFIFLTCLVVPSVQARIITGDERTDLYLPLLQGKRVGIFSNHTGMAGKTHILDLLLSKKVNVTCAFGPEHGFRGTASAGEHVATTIDEKTGIPILSLYNGKGGRPAQEDMEKFDVLIADIQDVGLRFYTYYVTLSKLMEACAENGKHVIILDRPNPNGHYVDGPILREEYTSGVGRFPIPVVHGMTLGELMLMANNKGWLRDQAHCRLTVIPCENYTHSTRVDITIPPSPNLPNIRSILLYPSLCYFEATKVSIGRGTDKPFQVVGHPDFGEKYNYTFTPKSCTAAIHPYQEDKLCRGIDLSNIPLEKLYNTKIDLSYVIDAYKELGRPDNFFRSFLELLIGTSRVRQMIEGGYTAEQIQATWKDEADAFKIERKPYLIYAE